MAFILTTRGRYDTHRIDSTEAFLHGELKGSDYLRQPQGFEESGKEHYVHKLSNSIYGLKQAPGIWCQYFKNCPTEVGFKALERCEFVSVESKHSWKVYSIINVGDMLKMRSNIGGTNEVKILLIDKVQLLDHGKVTTFFNPIQSRSPWHV